MEEGRAVEIAVHVDLGRRAVVVGIGGEDDVPIAVQLMQFGSPQISGVIGGFWRLEKQFGLGIVPVGQDGTAQQGDVDRVGVHEVFGAI